jgi:CRP/FNR family cyclic AMP-dependent transcriptional regulator
MMESHVETLLEHPFFKGMSEEDIRTIADCGEDASFEEGQIIFRQNEVAVRFFILLEGTVSLEMQAGEQEAHVIQTRGPGDVFGWSWIFPGEEWKFNARVVDPVKAIVIHTPCLHGKIENDAELGYELLRRFAGIMVDRLQATRMQLMDIYRPA